MELFYYVLIIVTYLYKGIMQSVIRNVASGFGTANKLYIYI